MAVMIHRIMPGMLVKQRQGCFNILSRDRPKRSKSFKPRRGRPMGFDPKATEFVFEGSAWLFFVIAVDRFEHQMSLTDAALVMTSHGHVAWTQLDSLESL